MRTAARTPTLIAALAAALFVTACRREAPAPAAQPAGVLAVVEGRAITEADFRHGWGERPAAADTPEARRALLDQLVERAALAGAARRAGLDQDPELAAEIERLLAGRLRATRLPPTAAPAEIPDRDLQAYYEQHRATRFTEPERLRAAVLWFDTRGEAPLVERYRPRLEAARAHMLKAGTNLPPSEGFGVLSVTNSEHRVSRFRGGDVGWLSASQLPNPWYAEALRLASALRQPGDLSEVTATPAGLFLVRLTERRPGGAQPFAAVRTQIQRALTADQRRGAEERFRQETLAAARIERPADAAARLAAVALPTPTNNTPATPPGPPALPVPALP
ncbi:MAG: hypothetical protein RJA22_3183 [Verrucomicrobiota bacterium]